MTKRERTYNHILDVGFGLVSKENLSAITIGHIAGACGMSRSGVMAHFQNKEDMHVAILERIRQAYVDQVVMPSHDEDALISLQKFLTAWCDWVHKAGYGKKAGCPLLKATAEYQDLPNDRVKKVIKRHQLELIAHIQKMIDRCIRHGHLDVQTDSQQMSFEIISLYHGRNLAKTLIGRDAANATFWRAISRLLGTRIGQYKVTH